MNLYYLSQDDRTYWDTYDSCIVCAENEEEAKKIHPNGSIFDETEKLKSWADSLETIGCTKIGIAENNVDKGVVIASFNAG